MIRRVPVSQAKVDLALGAEDGDQFLLLTGAHVAAVRVNGVPASRTLGSLVRALRVHVVRHPHVRQVTTWHRDRLVAQGTDGHLVVFQVRTPAPMVRVLEVVLAEDAAACITSHRQEVCVCVTRVSGNTSDLMRIRLGYREV